MLNLKLKLMLKLMLQLAGHELYKLSRNKGTCIGLILCMFVYGIYAYSNVPSVNNNYHNVYKYYRIGEGRVTSRDILAAKVGMARLNKIHDAGIKFSDKELGEMLLYRDINNSAKESSRYLKLLLELKEHNGSKGKLLQYRMLKNVGPLSGAYYTEGWKEIIDFWGNIGYYLAVILGIFVTSRIFPDEKASGMDVLILSTLEGRRKLIMAKIAAAIVAAVSITIIFELINLLFNAFVYGLAGWNMPLKNIFFETPYNLEIWKYWILKLLMASAFITILGLITMMISVVTKNSVISLTTGGLVFLVYDMATRNVAITKTHELIGLMAADFVRLKGFCANYSNIYELFGHAITYEQVLFSIFILFAIVIMSSTYFAGRKLK